MRTKQKKRARASIKAGQSSRGHIFGSKFLDLSALPDISQSIQARISRDKSGTSSLHSASRSVTDGKRRVSDRTAVGSEAPAGMATISHAAIGQSHAEIHPMQPTPYESGPAMTAAIHPEPGSPPRHASQVPQLPHQLDVSPGTAAATTAANVLASSSGDQDRLAGRRGSPRVHGYGHGSLIANLLGGGSIRVTGHTASHPRHSLLRSSFERVNSNIHGVGQRVAPTSSSEMDQVADYDDDSPSMRLRSKGSNGQYVQGAGTGAAHDHPDAPLDAFLNSQNLDFQAQYRAIMLRLNRLDEAPDSESEKSSFEPEPPAPEYLDYML